MQLVKHSLRQLIVKLNFPIWVSTCYVLAKKDSAFESFCSFSTFFVLERNASIVSSRQILVEEAVDVLSNREVSVFASASLHINSPWPQ